MTDKWCEHCQRAHPDRGPWIGGSDRISEIVDWQLTHRPEPTTPQTYACGRCHQTWTWLTLDPHCPNCGNPAE